MSRATSRQSGMASALSAMQEGRTGAVAVRLMDADGRTLPVLTGGEEVLLEIAATAECATAKPRIRFEIRDRLGDLLFAETAADEADGPLAPNQDLTARFRFRMPFLREGNYAVSAGLLDGNGARAAWRHEALIFEVVPQDESYGLVPIKSANMISVEGGGDGWEEAP